MLLGTALSSAKYAYLRVSKSLYTFSVCIGLILIKLDLISRTWLFVSTFMRHCASANTDWKPVPCRLFSYEYELQETRKSFRSENIPSCPKISISNTLLVIARQQTLNPQSAGIPKIFSIAAVLQNAISYVFVENSCEISSLFVTKCYIHQLTDE